MSDTAILPGLASGADGSGTRMSPPDDLDQSSANDRRKLFIVGGVAGLLVLGGGYYFLHHGSSTTPTPAASVLHKTPVVHHVAPTPAKASSPVTSTKLPKVDHHPVIRDPFHPLVVAPVSGATQAGGTTTVTSTGTGTAPATGTAPGTGTLPVTGTAPVVTTPPAGTTSTGPIPRYVELIKTSGTKSAEFMVGYKKEFRVYLVDAPASSSTHGTLFDVRFSLLSVANNQVRLQIGDGAPFTLTKGVAHVL